jgi:hypothetical protein
MVLKENEQILYDKWLKIFKDIIKQTYQEKYPIFFTDSRIEKLAQENARYLISVFTPTSMVYSTTYRQLNYLYGFLQSELAKPNKTPFEVKLSDSIKEFCDLIKTQTPYIDETLVENNKGRELSLFNNKYNSTVEYFGDVYCTNYKGSFAQLAQAQRHRTLSYNLSFLDQPEFYVPLIIKKDKALVDEWLADCKSQTNVFPQGMLVNICEKGTMENFILKLKERKCTFAQLEINKQASATLKKYIAHLEKNNHTLKLYDKGARCTFPDFKCTAPCRFKEGITEERII